jgi:Uma2 family endonuclease
MEPRVFRPGVSNVTPIATPVALTPADDDGIVRGRETMRRRELVWGRVREPPAPLYNHQWYLTRLTVSLTSHVRGRGLGQVCVAPVDVVLDEARALVVQPDIVFVSTARLGIIDRRIWGAPDLVVEVLSARTARRDRTVKLGWYQRYGVSECWLVDHVNQQVEVLRLRATRRTRRTYRSGAVLRSGVLRGLRLPVIAIFEA